ncbi:MAG: pantetheine-phosphate adenylyltransferase [Thermoleophilia bacterium]|nr:pantetheine-phosphate adenylyltransferase [Thermoleophilia bacterium]
MSATGRIAIYPGTYDPVTYGHLDVVERAARLFDVVVVSIAEGSTTKQPLFTAEERKALVVTSVEHLETVEVRGFNCLVADHAREVGAVAIVKGVRTAADFEYETQMAQFNRRLGNGIETVLLPASPEWAFLSSSGCREAAAWGASVDEWVPPHVAEALRDRIGRTA